MVKCEHGLYIPKADESTGKSWGCYQCYPDGHPEAVESPTLPRSNISLERNNEKQSCAKCGNMRTYFTNNCRNCGSAFPEEELRGRDVVANRRQPGVCPNCGSSVHYDTARKSFWQCADCETEFKAPKLKESESEAE